MRLFIVSALALTIAACSGEATADKGGSDEASGDESSPSDAAAAEAFSPGTYTLLEDSEKESGNKEALELTLGADETFEVKEGDRVEATGTYTVSDIEGGRKACFVEPEEDPEDEGFCFTVGERQDDGTWTATNPGGETATMTLVGE
ncbi:MAG: hypothetical protein ABJP70_09790 [Erythrobacter sp.]